MSDSQEMTPWFPAELKPVRIGAYPVQVSDMNCDCCSTEAVWIDGGWWRYGKSYGMRVRQEVTNVKRWRGFVKQSDTAQRSAS